MILDRLHKLVLGAITLSLAGLVQPPAVAAEGAGPGYQPDFLTQLLRFRDNVDFRFRDRILSPLSERQRLTFQGLHYFEPVPELALTALFEKAADRTVFAMPTFDRRTLRYSHYGTLSATLDGRPVTLKAYRREESDGRQNVLLVPFRDATNGQETYPGGRYIEMVLPLSEHPVLDFNRAMNPLCAYDPSYACPIPPRENHLPVPIRAGEMQYSPRTQPPAS